MPKRQKPKLRAYHATMIVTREEEWCVDASSPEEARALLEAGQGHRCNLGELVQSDIDRMLDEG